MNRGHVGGANGAVVWTLKILTNHKLARGVEGVPMFFNLKKCYMNFFRQNG